MASHDPIESGTPARVEGTNFLASPAASPSPYARWDVGGGVAGLLKDVWSREENGFSVGNDISVQSPVLPIRYLFSCASWHCIVHDRRSGLLFPG